LIGAIPFRAKGGVVTCFYASIWEDFMTLDQQSALRRLMDKDEIIDLVHQYSYYVDHRRMDKVFDLFIDDCVIDYGPALGPPMHGLAAFRAMAGGGGGGGSGSGDGGGGSLAATSHHNANILITFEDDDRASVRTSMYAWHKLSDGTAPRLWGYYHDTVVRASNGWRFATRQLRILGNEDWDAEWYPAIGTPGE
jgi:SnoaL-like domain